MDPNQEIKHILATVPEQFHEDVKENITTNGIIAAIVGEVIPRWTEEQQEEALGQVEKNAGVYKTILVDIFKLDQAKDVARSHKDFIQRVFWRFETCFTGITEDQILEHDLSKFRLVELHIQHSYSDLMCVFQVFWS